MSNLKVSESYLTCAYCDNKEGETVYLRDQLDKALAYIKLHGKCAAPSALKLAKKARAEAKQLSDTMENASYHIRQLTCVAGSQLMVGRANKKVIMAALEKLDSLSDDLLKASKRSRIKSNDT